MVKLLERLGGTKSPPMMKQARILEESSGGSGEAPVRFKVVCPWSGVRRWMWRGPHAFVALEVEDLVRCFGCLVCKVQQRYFSEGSCLAVASSVWCGGLLF
jgi:hypothetical protein